MNLSSPLSKDAWSLYRGGTLVASAGITFYFETILRHISDWLTYEGSYRLLILGLGVYMTWQRGRHVKEVALKPNMAAGSLLTAVGCFLAICGDRSSTLLLEDASLIITLLGLVWLLLGFRYLKAFWFCVAYLAFALPVFEESLKISSPYLQIIAAWIASSLLKIGGMSVFLSGQHLQLPHFTLNVIEECSGIHHITTLLALALPLIVMSKKSAQAKGMLIVATGFIGLFCNGLRIALIGIWTTQFKSGSTHGPFDIFYVSFILIVGSALLLLTNFLAQKIAVKISNRMKSEPSKASKREAAPVTLHFRYLRWAPIQKETMVKPICGSNLKFRRVSAEMALPILSALIILIVAGGYLHLIKPNPVYLQKPLSSFPSEIGKWKATISLMNTDLSES